SETSTTQDSTVTCGGLASSPRAKALHMAAMKAQGKSQRAMLATRRVGILDLGGRPNFEAPRLDHRCAAVPVAALLVAAGHRGARSAGELRRANRRGGRHCHRGGRRWNGLAA